MAEIPDLEHQQRQEMDAKLPTKSCPQVGPDLTFPANKWTKPTLASQLHAAPSLQERFISHTHTHERLQRVCDASRAPECTVTAEEENQEEWRV